MYPKIIGLELAILLAQANLANAKDPSVEKRAEARLQSLVCEYEAELAKLPH